MNVRTVAPHASQDTMTGRWLTELRTAVAVNGLRDKCRARR